MANLGLRSQLMGLLYPLMGHSHMGTHSRNQSGMVRHGKYLRTKHHKRHVYITRLI